MVPAYKAMLAYAKGDLPVSTDVDLPPRMGVDIAMDLNKEELEIFMRVLAASRRVPQEAVPPATYDGSGGTRRLISTLRPRRR